MNGNCAGGGTPNVCNTALTNVDPASIAFTSFAGTQIWFYVTSLETNGEFLVCVSSTNGFINPGIDCNSATALCNTYDFHMQEVFSLAFQSYLLALILLLFDPSGINLM